MKFKKFSLLLFFLISFHLVAGYYTRGSVHSEGALFITDWGKIIVGIDFERKKFIYTDEIDLDIVKLWKFSVKLKSFFPHIVINFDGKDFPVLWIFYYTPFISKVLSSVLRFFGIDEKAPDFLGESFYVVLFVVCLEFLIFLPVFYIVSRELLSDKFRDLRYAFLLTFFFFIFSSSHISLIYQFHHLQACVFFLIFIYFLKKRRYILAGISGGLTIFSYLPSTFAVLGGYINQIFYFRDFRKTFFAFLITSMFAIPYVFYMNIVKNIDYKKIYGCTDCVFYVVNEEAGRATGGKLEEVSNPLKFSKILFREILENFFPTNLFRNLKKFLPDLKESFSLSDISKRYGLTYSDPPLKKISDIAIWIYIVVLIYGLLFVFRTFEVGIFFFSFMFYIVFWNILIFVPKMLYILLPVISVISAKALQEIKIRAKDIYIIFIISSVLRFVDVFEIQKKYPPYLREKETKEVVDFFMRNNITSVYQFCLPIAFKLYSKGKIEDVKTILLSFRYFRDERVMRFVLENTDIVVLDSRAEDVFRKVAPRDMKIVFKNQAFFVAKRD